MITALARGAATTVTLPVQVPVFACLIMACLGGIPLIAAGTIMRDSRDLDTRAHAREMVGWGAAIFALSLGAIIAVMFVFQSQGGFE